MTETIIISIIGSGALSAVISGIFALLANRQKTQRGIAKAVQLALYNDISSLIDKATAAGYITQEQMRHLLEMHSCYHDLGGNGFLDKKMELATELPMKG